MSGHSQQARSEINFGIHVPYLKKNTDADELIKFAEKADQLGFHSLWVSDALFREDEMAIDAISFLSFVAARTKKILVATTALIFPIRPPVLVARSIATLDYLSSGRAILGIGIGSHPSIYAATGVNMSKRVRDYGARLEAVKALWTQENVSLSAADWRLHKAALYPRPVQKPHPPIWIAGTADAVLRRVARWGNGWIARGSTTIDGIRSGRANLDKLAVEYDRNPGEIVIAKPTFICIKKDAHEALQELRGYLQTHYTTSFNIQESCLVGPSNECRRMTKEFVKSGLNCFILYPTTTDLDNLELIANELVYGFKPD